MELNHDPWSSVCEVLISLWCTQSNSVVHWAMICLFPQQTTSILESTKGITQRTSSDFQSSSSTSLAVCIHTFNNKLHKSNGNVLQSALVHTSVWQIRMFMVHTRCFQCRWRWLCLQCSHVLQATEPSLQQHQQTEITLFHFYYRVIPLNTSLWSLSVKKMPTISQDN